MKKLSKNEFCDYIRRSLEITSEVDLETLVFEDLGLDSISVYELLIAVEELGVQIDEMAWTRCNRVGDFYSNYLSASGEP